jgi:hypothetical protein
MLLDLTYFFSIVRSAAWAWTMEAIEGFMDCLHLEEHSRSPGRREFRASNGLRCSIHSDVHGDPVRIEFPVGSYEIEAPEPELTLMFFEMTTQLVLGLLGPAAFRGAPSTSFPSVQAARLRTHWSLPTVTVAVEARDGCARAMDTVVLALERDPHGLADFAFAGVPTAAN